MKRAFALVLAVAALVVAMTSSAFADIKADDDYPFTGTKTTGKVFEPQVLNFEPAVEIVAESDYPYKGWKQ